MNYQIKFKLEKMKWRREEENLKIMRFNKEEEKTKCLFVCMLKLKYMWNGVIIN